MLHNISVLSGVVAVGKYSAIGGAGAQTEPVYFQITDVSPRETSLDQPEPVTLEVTVENTGDETGTQTLEAVVGGVVVDTTRISLGGGFDFTAQMTVPADALSFDQSTFVTLQTEDDDSTALINVAAPPEPAEFSVSELDPRTVDLDEPGATVTVSATVTNDGEAEGTQTVSLTLDGEALASEDVTLAGGESTTVSFDVDTRSLEFGTDYEHGIAIEDDTTIGLLTISPEPTPTATETQTPTSTVEVENDGDTGVLPGTDDETDTLGILLVLLSISGGGLWLARRRNNRN